VDCSVVFSEAGLTGADKVAGGTGVFYITVVGAPKT
jgi:hypothetical protein